MQMLRCTRDTALSPPDDHHQDHEQHHRDDGRHPSELTDSTRCPAPASRTTRSSGTLSPQALVSQLTPSHRTPDTWGNGLCATQVSGGGQRTVP